MCYSPVKKGRVKSIFSFSPLFLLEKHITLLSSAPSAYFMESQRGLRFFSLSQKSKAFISFPAFPERCKSTPQLSPNDTQPLSLNLERKPVHIAPVFKEIPKEILPTQCPWSTVAILSCAAPVGTGGSLRPLPVHTILFSSVSKAGWSHSPMSFSVSL